MNADNKTLAMLQPKPSALAIMANRFNVDPKRLHETLKSTVFKGASDDELMALVVVANEYGLNPLTKEIYAFPAKGGGIVPVVSVDGWNNLANSHPQMDGMEFAFDHDDKGKLVSCTCTIYRKDRSRPIKVTEYLDECKRNTDPWKMEHRMLRHKALIQCVRVAFGFSGIVDEDDAQRIGNGRVVDIPAATIPCAPTPVNRPVQTKPVEAESFSLSDDAPTILAQVTAKIASAGLDASDVLAEAERGGLFIDASIPIGEQPEDSLRDVLGAFDAIASQMKGGSK